MLPPDLVVTTWTPDTCNCQVNYSWDRNSTEEERVHTYYSPADAEAHGVADKVQEVVCEDHRIFGVEGQDNYDQVLAENQTKNQFLAHVAEQANLLDDDGNPDYAGIPYTFDAQRVLNVSVADIPVPAAPSLGATQNMGKVGTLQPTQAAVDASTLQSTADSMFGDGKVKVS